jgi:branched-subunit amino acid transport protein
VEVRASVLLIIVGCGLVTVLPRVLPLAILSRFELPDPVVRWLGYVPVAVLAALLAQTVLLAGGRIALPPENLAGLAILPALFVAIRTRSMLGTVAVGVVAMAVLRLWLG